MTIKELYEWAIEHGVEDYDIEVYSSFGETTYCTDAYIEKNCVVSLA